MSDKWSDDGGAGDDEDGAEYGCDAPVPLEDVDTNGGGEDEGDEDTYGAESEYGGAAFFEF